MTFARQVYDTIRTVREARGNEIQKVPSETWAVFEWLVLEGYTT